MMVWFAVLLCEFEVVLFGSYSLQRPVCLLFRIRGQYLMLTLMLISCIKSENILLQCVLVVFIFFSR